MEISDSLMQIKSSAKIEKDLPTYEIVFLFVDVIRPIGLILNHDDPTKCFVLFSTAAPIEKIYKQVRTLPGWGITCI